MISQIFILSARGDILINRDLRHDLVRDTPEVFFRQVKLAREDRPPVFNVDGVNYVYLHKYAIYVVATTRFNVSPALVFEYVSQVIKVIKDFCGVLSEESIRKNFVLIYEIIDEMMDFGYPQLTSTETVKDYVVSPPEVCTGAQLPRKQLFAQSTIKVGATANPITNADGEVVSEVPVPKGTNLVISIWAYNRLQSIWGPDADEFNPHRFIEHEKIGATYVGVTSNLMTFSAGMQACLGWRFS